MPKEPNAPPGAPPPRPLRKARAGLTMVELVLAVAAGTLLIGGGLMLLRSAVGGAGASMAASVARSGTSTLATALEAELGRGQNLMVGPSRADDLELLRVVDRDTARAPVGRDIRAMTEFPPGHMNGGIPFNGPVAVVNTTGDVLFTNARSTPGNGLILDCPVTIPAGDWVDIVTFESVRFRLAGGRILAQSVSETLELGRATTLNFAPRGRNGDVIALGTDYADVPLTVGGEPLDGFNFDLTHRVGDVNTSDRGASHTGTMVKRVWQCGEGAATPDLLNGEVNVTITARGTHDESRATPPVVTVLNDAGQTAYTVTGWHHTVRPQVGVQVRNLPEGNYTGAAPRLTYSIEGDTVSDGVWLDPDITGRPQLPVFVSRMYGAAINVEYGYVLGSVNFSANIAQGGGVLTLLATGEQWAVVSGQTLPLKPGRYRFDARTVSGYGAPTPSPQELFVRSNRATALSVTYPQNTGALAFVAEGGGGAAWVRVQSRFTPMIDTTLQDGQVLNNAPAGDYWVEPQGVSGWSGPDPSGAFVVTVPPNAMETVRVRYTQNSTPPPAEPPPPTGQGTLRISIVGTSQTVRITGSRPDGTSIWADVSGTVEFPNRPAGTYTLNASAVSGINGPSPASQPVTVPSGGTGTATFTYGGAPPVQAGNLRIAVTGTSSTVTGSMSGPVSRSVTGNTIVEGLAPGTYTVTMPAISGLQGPSPSASQTVTVPANMTATVIFRYGASTGNLRITVTGTGGEHVGGTMSGPVNRSVSGNSTVSNLPPGNYTVVLDALQGYWGPFTNDSVGRVRAGETATVTFRYVVDGSPDPGPTPTPTPSEPLPPCPYGDPRGADGRCPTIVTKTCPDGSVISIMDTCPPPPPPPPPPRGGGGGGCVPVYDPGTGGGCP